MARPTVARTSARRRRLELVLAVAHRLVAAGRSTVFWRSAIRRLKARLAELPAEPAEDQQVRRRGKAKAKQAG